MWAKRAMVLGGHGGTDGAGHCRAAYGKLTWCMNCGAYAEKWAVGLAAPCRGHPTAPSQVRVLNRLRRARHPRSNAALEHTLVLEAPMREGTRTAEKEDEGAQSTAGLKNAKRGRSTAGYLRLLGGSTPVETGVRESSCEEALDGPRAKLLRRNKAMRLSGADLALQGEERERREAEAWEAREEGWKEEAGLVALWCNAMEAGQAPRSGGEEVASRSGPGGATSGETERQAAQQGGHSVPLSRKGLVHSLQQQNSRAQRRARVASAERAEQKRRRGA